MSRRALSGAGFSVTEVGAINKILGLVATIVGALAGGALMARLRLYRALLGKQGLIAQGGPPQRLADLIAKDRPRWAKVVKDAQITAE